MNKTVTSRRELLRAGGGLFVGIAGTTLATKPARADDIVEFESCVGPDGGFVEEIEEDGDEERAEFDGNGTVRRLFEEDDDDGDDLRRIFDANGTLIDSHRDDDDLFDD